MDLDVEGEHHEVAHVGACPAGCRITVLGPTTYTLVQGFALVHSMQKLRVISEPEWAYVSLQVCYLAPVQVRLSASLCPSGHLAGTVGRAVLLALGRGQRAVKGRLLAVVVCMATGCGGPDLVSLFTSGFC